MDATEVTDSFHLCIMKHPQCKEVDLHDYSHECTFDNRARLQYCTTA